MARLPLAEIDQVLAQRPALEVIDALEAFVSEARRARIEAVLGARLRSVQVAIERPWDPHNAAAVVRSAEAFGAGAVHVIAASARILRARKTTAGTHRWIETRHHATLEPFVEEMRAAGMIIAAACVEESCALEDLPVERPIALLLGNEHDGLSAEARDQADVHYRVPMLGFAESLNLSVCAAVSLHSVLGRRRAFLGVPGDLDPEEFARGRARWYLNSVDARLARGLFDPGR